MAVFRETGRDFELVKPKSTKKSAKQKAYDVHQLFRSYNGSQRQRWQRTHQEVYDFFLGDQLTKEELTDLKASGIPDFIINMIIPSVELMRYFLTANNPRWQAVGREDSDIDIASVFAAIGEYVWHISGGKALLGQNIINAIVKSKMYWHVIIDKDSDQGLGEVKIEMVDAFSVYVAPDTNDIYERDSTAKIIHKQLSRKALMEMLPEYRSKIKTASSIANFEYYSERDINESNSIQREDITSGFDDDGSISDMMDYFEKYRKVKLPYYSVVVSIPPTAKEIDEVNKLVEIEIEELTKELQVELIEKADSLNKAVDEGKVLPQRRDFELEKMQKQAEESIEIQRQRLYSKAREEATKVQRLSLKKNEYELMKSKKDIAPFIISADEYFETRIERSCVVGDKLLYEYVLPDPINEYPLFSIPAIYTNTVYPISFIAPAIGKQKEINKAHQIMIHNANLGSNLRALIQEGQVDDDAWDKYMSSAGARLYWRNLGDGTKPEFIQPLPLSNAFFALTEKGQQDFEYLVGMVGTSMGLTDNQSETYRGMLANDEFSTRRLRGWTSNVFEPGMQLLGRIVGQFSQAVYSAHKVFRIVQPNAETGEIKTISAEVNLPLYNDKGEEIGRFKDLQSANIDIVYVSGSTMPVNRWALLEEYFRWFQAGLIDDIEFVRHTDIQDKEGLMQRKSLYQSMQSQISQLENSIKNKEGDIETLSRQILQLSIKAKESGMVNEMRKDVLTTESQQVKLRDKMKNEFDYNTKILKEEAAKASKNLDNSKK